MIRTALSAARLLWALAARLPAPRVILDRAGRSPYLSRYYLLGRGGEDGGNDHAEWFTWEGAPVGVFLHCFHRSDDDAALHNHPWAWAVSLILSGGYLEERRVAGARVARRVVRPGQVNVIRHDTFHRVDLLGTEAWSLFVAGPRVADWGFWDRQTGRYVPHGAYFARYPFV
jgi:hypothetical protein